MMVDPTLALLDKVRLWPKNRLLAALPHDVLLGLRPSLQVVPLPRGKVLCEVDEPLRRVYFLEAGAVSLVTVFEDGSTAEMATVGREGVLGIGLLLGAEQALARHVVSVSGLALAVETCQFRNVLRRYPQVCTTCEGYARGFVANLLQNVACNATHRIEQRCARWLLMCGDHTEDDTVELTQEYLSEMLGVRRSTVTLIASALQQAGFIRYRRGAITVLDRRGLEGVACECYRIVRTHYEQPLGAEARLPHVTRMAAQDTR